METDIQNSKILILRRSDCEYGKDLQGVLKEKFKISVAEECMSINDALQLLKENEFEIVIVDVEFAVPEDDVDILSVIQESHYQNLYIMMMGKKDIDFNLVAQGFKKGANDFLHLPVEEKEVGESLRNAVVERNQFKQQISQTSGDIQTISTVETPLQAIVRSIEKLLSQRYTEQQMKAALTAILKSLGNHDLFKPSTDATVVKNVPWLGEYNVIDKTSIIPRLKKKHSFRDILNIKTPQTPKMKEEYKFPPDPVRQKTLESLGSTEFDIFKYDENDLCRGITEMFTKMNLIETFRINPGKLANFIKALRVHYNSNHYHNFTHAFDVTQFAYALLQNEDVRKILSTPLDQFIVIFSALCHDISHPGTNNAFQVKTRSEIAMRYNDIHVLENFHTHTAFSLVKEERNNILENLSPEEYAIFREGVIKSILATDPAEHFAILVKFQTHIKAGKLDPSSKDDKFLAMMLVLKTADISNVCRPFDIAAKWSEKIVKEFIQQGDKEKQLGLDVTPIMDRNKMNKAQSQISFMDYIAAPWHNAITSYWSSLEPLRLTMDANKQKWMDIKAKEEIEGTAPSYKDVVVTPHTPAFPTMIYEDDFDFSSVVKNVGMDILVVSNHMKTLDICKNVLFQGGYLSEMANSVTEAEEMVTKRSYTVIILDLGIFDVKPFCSVIQSSINANSSVLFISDELHEHVPDYITKCACKPLHTLDFLKIVDHCVDISVVKTPPFELKKSLKAWNGSMKLLRKLITERIIPMGQGFAQRAKPFIDQNDFPNLANCAKELKVTVNRARLTVLTHTAYCMEKAAMDEDILKFASHLLQWEERFKLFLKAVAAELPQEEK